VNNKSRKSTAHWRKERKEKLDDYNTRIHDKSFKVAAAGKKQTKRDYIMEFLFSKKQTNKLLPCLALPMQ
jgi:hypothetical protein